MHRDVVSLGYCAEVQDAAAYDEMLVEWLELSSSTNSIDDWEKAFAEAAAAEKSLVSAGQWRTGGRTLLHALGLHHSEVHLCAGLAWLLTPDGWHGLGSTFLRAFLAELGVIGIDTSDAGRARVVTEEVAADTRADLIIRLPDSMRTVLVEAKVWAGEQETQCDRLARHWGAESPTLVFLTRTGGLPGTALKSVGQWHTLTWHRVGQLLADVAHGRVDCAPGVTEYLHTIQTYGGKPRG